MKKLLIQLVHGGLLSLAVSTSVLAQNNNERSPYSRYGYGRLGARQTAAARAMGGLGISLRDGLVANPANPASYTAVDSMTFIMDLAVSLRGAYLKENGKTDSRVLGNLDYATILFPVSRHLAVSAGIMPFSTVGYQFGNTQQLEGTEGANPYRRTYSGQGSINDLYLGLAGRIGHFSLGVNAAYLFGYTSHQRQINFLREEAVNPIYLTQLHLTGFKVDAGLQYELMLDKKHEHSLTIGATFAPKMSLRSERIQQQLRYNGQTNQSTLQLSDTTSSTSQHIVPLSAGFGISYRRANSLLIGLDASYQKWSESKYTDGDASFTDRYRAALGLEWIPNHRARNPFSQARYRLGLSGANSYLKVPTPSGELTGYTELGASLGVGIPLIDRRSLLNISIDYNYLRPGKADMVSEHSLGLTVGVTFNEGWFRKARIN